MNLIEFVSMLYQLPFAEAAACIIEKRLGDSRPYLMLKICNSIGEFASFD